MPLTNFPFGVTSFGAPIVPGPGVVPSVPSAYGAGVYFLDGTHGDDAFNGTDPLHAFKTLDRAYNATKGGYNEIIYVLGSTNSINYSSAIASGGSGLVWSKSFTHLIGLTAPGMIGQRARISNGASTNLYTPLLDVTGSGCLFQNLEFFNGGNHATEAAVCIRVKGGSRNAFLNCQISGGGHATSGADATARSLVVDGTTATGVGAGEHFFGHCYIGLDTIDKAGASSEVEMLGATTRNIFEDCVFSAWTSTGSNFFFKIGASGIDRFCLIRRCQFMNAFTLSGGVAMADAMSLNAACGGQIMLASCLISGCTATAATKTDLYFDNIWGSTTTAKALVAGW